VVLVAVAAGAVAPARAASMRRIAGDDRYATAAAVALDRWTSPSDVVLASGTNPTDALAGAFVSGLHSSPVLLTARDALPPATIDAIRRMRSRRVHVIGGTASISDAVVDALESDGLEVQRHAGVDRYATAVAAGKSEGSAIVGWWRDLGPTAILASGVAPFDALAAGPLAAGQLFPILLTAPDALPASTARGLDDLGIAHVIVLGGTGAVSDAVVAELEASGRTVRRVAGVDRAGTAVAVAGLIEELGYDIVTAVLTSGTNPSDALGAGPWGAPDRPVLLCDTPSFCGPSTTEWSKTHPLEELVVVGGTAAVSDGAAMAVATP
jgi:putative cell wall-binding protein